MTFRVINSIDLGLTPLQENSRIRSWVACGMKKTRERLRHLLRLLEDAIPGLMEGSTGDAGFWSAFTYKAMNIQGQACPADQDWVAQQLDAMLQQYAMTMPLAILRSDCLAA